MKWHRRDFLKIFTVATPALFVPMAAPEWAIWEKTPDYLAQVKQTQPVLLTQVSALATRGKLSQFCLARPNGTPLLMVPMNGGTFGFWPSPEQALVCTGGLLNLSDADLDVYLHFRQGERGWVEHNGKIIEYTL